MSQDKVDSDSLAVAMHQVGHDRFLAVLGDSKDAWLGQAVDRLAAFVREYEQRHGERVSPLALLGYRIKAAAFFHPTTLNASPAMQVAIWRILTGCEISTLELAYSHAATPRLRIGLTTPYGVAESYESFDPRDMRIIRHIGMTDCGTDCLIFDGYYAPQTADASKG